MAKIIFKLFRLYFEVLSKVKYSDGPEIRKDKEYIDLLDNYVSNNYSNIIDIIDEKKTFNIDYFKELPIYTHLESWKKELTNILDEKRPELHDNNEKFADIHIAFALGLHAKHAKRFSETYKLSTPSG